MSDLRPIADSRRAARYVRFGPGSDIVRYTRSRNSTLVQRTPANFAILGSPARHLTWAAVAPWGGRRAPPRQDAKE